MPSSNPETAIAASIDQSQQIVCSQFIVTDEREGVLYARLSGPHIGEREAQIIARELNAAVNNARAELHTVVMDMKNVRAMSSLGLGMCIDVRNTAHSRGAKTVMMSLCRELYELFRMMKVDRLYTIARNREELRKLL